MWIQIPLAFQFFILAITSRTPQPSPSAEPYINEFAAEILDILWDGGPGEQDNDTTLVERQMFGQWPGGSFPLASASEGYPWLEGID